jgi:serine/threonine-protein kinase
MTEPKPNCSRCGKDMPPESRFCLHCGKRVDRRSIAMGPASVRLQRALGDQYEVLEEIGSGNFAVVYAVADLRLDRRLAVKVIRPEFVASDVVVARFRREAKIVAQLKHENVLGISFAGEGAGLVYCAMPLIVGETLRERVKAQGALTTEQALRVFGELAQGLSHAHEKGIIHRDVKPANIMLDREAADRTVLLDFGIAKALFPTGGKLSISGQIIGSAEYMSPERKAGSKSIDARSDIYSMGVVAFQMLTARLPAGLDTPTQPASEEAHRVAPDVRAVRADVPEAFAAAIERCTRHAPEDRWASAIEAATAAGAQVS